MSKTRAFALPVVALALIAGTVDASANAKPEDEKKAVPVEEAAKPVEETGDEGPVVTITGGDVSTTTTLDISADGGTAISDASGGDGNFAFDAADAVVEEDEGPGGVLGLAEELAGIGADDAVAGDIAAAGNGGTANAEANGGTVSVGDINSGGNTGSTISVGDVGVAEEEAKPVEVAKPVAPKKVEAPKVVEAPKAVAPKEAKAPKVVEVAAPEGGERAARGGRARAARGGDGNGDSEAVQGLPSTGAGLVQGETGVNDALIALAAVGAVAAAGYGLRRRIA